MLCAVSPSLRTFASLASTDDQLGGIVVAPSYQPPDGISVRPEARGHRLADDDDGLRFRPVGVVEVALAEDLDARGFEEPGSTPARSAMKVPWSMACCAARETARYVQLDILISMTSVAL